MIIPAKELALLEAYLTGHSFLTDAPSDGNIYGRQNANWAIALLGGPLQALVEADPIQWNAALGSASLTLTASHAMAAPTGLLPRGHYFILITQGGAGSFTITAWDPVFLWPGGLAPTLSVDPGDMDMLFFECDGAHLIFAGFQPGLIPQSA